MERQYQPQPYTLKWMKPVCRSPFTLLVSFSYLSLAGTFRKTGLVTRSKPFRMR